MLYYLVKCREQYIFSGKTMCISGEIKQLGQWLDISKQIAKIEKGKVLNLTDVKVKTDLPGDLIKLDVAKYKTLFDEAWSYVKDVGKVSE